MVRKICQGEIFNGTGNDCYATIDMLQKKKTNSLKNVMMLITTKTHNERGVYLHEYYSTGSTVSSTGSKIFAKARSNGGKHKV